MSSHVPDTPEAPGTDPAVPAILPAAPPAPAPRAARRVAAKPAAAASFRQAYDLLQSHAETLRRQSEPNIDDLLTIVNESVGAYKLCKERIDAVEQALEAALSGADADEAAAPAPRPAARTGAEAPADPDVQDDDIPF